MNDHFLGACMRHRFLTTTSLAASLVLYLAAGCGSAGPVAPVAVGPVAVGPAASSPAAADQSVSGLHACRLVPASVVTQVLGALLERPYETADGRMCFYNTALTAGNGGPSYILSVTTRSGYEAAKAFAQGAAESGAERFAAARNLGDDSFSISTDSGAPDYSLWAAKAGRAVEINVNDLGQGPVRAHDLVAAALGSL
jgi:hypothetical protein